MKRAVLCVTNPQDYIDQLDDYSIMIVNPAFASNRIQYLINKSDYSLLIDSTGEHYREGNDYSNERLLWYTSGTTGDSKFCSFSQQQLDILAEKICKAYNITSNDRYTSIMSLSHAHGQGMYWATKLAKCKVTFLPTSEIRKLPDTHPTFITAVPDFLKIIGQMTFDDLRFIRSASASLSNNLYTQLKEKFRVPIVEAFGMTEALSHCFTNPLEGEQRIGTIGLPDGIEADIVDQQLYIKGPTIFQPGWYNTGDLADRDEKGYYRILGRHKDQLNIKGIKLNPLSLEQQLRDNVLGLLDCVIFGIDRVKCLYTGTCTQTDVYNYLNSLGSYCRPKLLEQVTEIPVSPSGKISRSWLNSNY